MVRLDRSFAQGSHQLWMVVLGADINTAGMEVPTMMGHLPNIFLAVYRSKPRAPFEIGNL